MSRTSRARAQLQAELEDGERLMAIASGLLKHTGLFQRAARDVALSIAGSLVTNAIIPGLTVSRSPAAPHVWIAVTDRRLVVLVDPRGRHDLLGDGVFVAPLDRVAVTRESGLWSYITIWEPATGERLARVNLGNRHRAATAIRAAAAGPCA